MSLRHEKRAVGGETRTLLGARHEAPSLPRTPGLLDGGHSLPGPPSRRSGATRTATPAAKDSPRAGALDAAGRRGADGEEEDHDAADGHDAHLAADDLEGDLLLGLGGEGLDVDLAELALGGAE